jgi:hypothetical protein
MYFDCINIQYGRPTEFFHLLAEKLETFIERNPQRRVYCRLVGFEEGLDWEGEEEEDNKRIVNQMARRLASIAAHPKQDLSNNEAVFCESCGCVAIEIQDLPSDFSECQNCILEGEYDAYSDSFTFDEYWSSYNGDEYNDSDFNEDSDLGEDDEDEDSDYETDNDGEGVGDSGDDNGDDDDDNSNAPGNDNDKSDDEGTLQIGFINLG